jgi:hypothetical protein
MGAPQIILIGIIVSSFTVTVIKHGEDKGKYNLWTWLISSVIEVGLLIWGGFFN